MRRVRVRKGGALTYLSADLIPWSEAFMRAYAAALEGAMSSLATSPSRIVPGSISELNGIYLWSRRHDEAVREFEKSISLDPNFALGYIMLGLSLYYGGKSKRALDVFDRVFALDPYHPDVYLHFQAQAYFQLGQFEKAVEILKRRLVRNPDTDISRALLASSYGHLGRNDEARREWQELLRVNPNYSVEHRRKVLPYKTPADFELFVDGLRKVGLAK